jgi:hypothetical protein
MIDLFKKSIGVKRHNNSSDNLISLLKSDPWISTMVLNRMLDLQQCSAASSELVELTKSLQQTHNNHSK